jgi:hypothetical protein
MTFFHVTLTVRDGGRAIKMIVEHAAPNLERLIDDINDPEYPWMVGTEHRTIRTDGEPKWVQNPCAVSVAEIARINEIRPPFDAAASSRKPPEAEEAASAVASKNDDERAAA